MIKYNKNLQKQLDINLEDSIYNYKFCNKTNKEILTSIEDMAEKLNIFKSYNYISTLSFPAKFCLKYSYYFPENINEKKENFFLTQYKGFKINDYPLPFNFNSLSFNDKINILEKNEYFIKYTLNNEQIELIDLINEIREKNNISQLFYTKNENIYDYFKEQKSDKEKYIFIYPIGEMKNTLIKKDDKIIKILLIDYLKYIMILEKGKNEYIFIYTDYIKKTIVNNPSIINKSTALNKNQKFFLINNTIPKLDLSFFESKNAIFNRLYGCLYEEGFQILSIIYDTLIGVLEGPLNTPYENGFFLFKMVFNNDFPVLSPPQFIFISQIFHPNISDNGFVSVDILQRDWSPAISRFDKIIYSVQSLLDDPNPDIFLNEKAAKLCKENKKNMMKL